MQPGKEFCNSTYLVPIRLPSMLIYLFSLAILLPRFGIYHRHIDYLPRTFSCQLQYLILHLQPPLSTFPLQLH